MNISKAKFYFPNGEEKESEIIKDSYNFQEIFHNGLKAADGSCSFKIPFNVEISNLFQSEINLGKVKIEIRDKDGININTYYCKDTLQIEKTQKNQPISIQAISPSFFIDETLKRTVVMLGKTVAEIIKALLKEIEFVDVRTIPVYTKLTYFVANEGEKVKDIITELLFEYGYVSYFDCDGFFNARPIYEELPENTDQITQSFDGTNLREKVIIKAKAHEADYVSASYNTVEYFRNTLIFSDTQNADDNNKCTIEIKPYYCIFESTEEKDERLKNNSGWKENYCEYDSTKGKVLYVSGISPDVYFDRGIEYNISRFDSEGNDLVDKCCLKAYNGTGASKFCRKFDIYGDAWIATEINTVISSTGTKVKEFDLKYIQNKQDAENFALNVANYYRFSNFEITAKSYVDYDLGSYVKITDYGIGTYYGRIIQKKRTLKNDCIEYLIETITDYTPAEIEKTKSKRNGTNAAIAIKGDKGEKGDPGTDGASLFVYAEQSTAVFNVDDIGQVEEAEVEIPIHVICDGVEMPFKIGPLDQPAGMSVEEYQNEESHGIRLHTTKDYLLENGTLDIPIIYTEVTHAYIYGDHSKNIALGINGTGFGYGSFSFDETSITDYNLVFTYSTARLAIYRGAKNTIDGFLAPDTEFNLHRGDWFTWTGEETSETYNKHEVKFETAKVYKWNGVCWEEDSNSEHQIVAISDVLSVAEANLTQNNQLIATLLSRLSNNETWKKLESKLAENNDFIKLLNSNVEFTDLLATNEALIKKLIANQAFINSLVSNESFTDLLSANTAFIQDLTANAAFVNQLVANDSFVKELTASTSFIDYLVTQTAFINAIFARNITLSFGGWIQSEGFDGNTTGFRLNGNGTFECVNGKFNGAIDSGPLKLNRSSAGNYTLSRGSGTELSDIYNTLLENGIFDGEFNVSGIFNGANTTKIRFYATTTTKSKSYAYVTNIGSVYTRKWQLGDMSGTSRYRDVTYDLYTETITNYKYIFVSDNGQIEGTRVKNSVGISRSMTYSQEYLDTYFEKGWKSLPYPEIAGPVNEYDNSNGITNGDTSLTFGEDTMTFKLLNLPNRKLSTLPVGCVYQENGFLKIVT